MQDMLLPHVMSSLSSLLSSLATHVVLVSHVVLLGLVRLLRLLRDLRILSLLGLLTLSRLARVLRILVGGGSGAVIEDMLPASDGVEVKQGSLASDQVLALVPVASEADDETLILDKVICAAISDVICITWYRKAGRTGDDGANVLFIVNETAIAGVVVDLDRVVLIQVSDGGTSTHWRMSIYLVDVAQEGLDILGIKRPHGAGEDLDRRCRSVLQR